MKFIKDNLVVFLAGLFTIIMLMVGGFYAYLHYSETDGIAEMGAFLAGIFAPIAWAWFLASYAVQSSELKLQRKELTLQRKALETQVEELKHSVQAQKGSEAALKEQSEALQKQLDITSKQFHHTLEQYIKNKPKFILNNLRLSDLMNNRSKRTNKFSCQFPIYNLGSDAKIKLVRANLSKAVIDDFPYADSLDVHFNDTVISITSSINLQRLRSKMLTEDDIKDEGERVEQAVLFYNMKAYLKVLTNLELEIFYYSTHTGAGSGKYKLDYQEDFVHLVLIPDSIELNTGKKPIYKRL